MVEILEFLPEGASIIAIVLIVFMYVRQITESQRLYQDQIKNMMDNFMEAYRENTVTLQKLNGRIEDIVK